MRVAVIIGCAAASLIASDLRAEQTAGQSVSGVATARAADAAGRRDASRRNMRSNVLIDASALVSDVSAPTEPVAVEQRLPPTTESADGDVVTTVVRTGERNSGRAAAPRKRASSASPDR